ncbi:hypothetical protein ACFQ08_10320 [Streptosporangium algeriense]|uniref:Uncharacterized protein n=1 Tax=Streptosporangium algeriense TaxID=1682748 RepID=A0ABW3DM24_9ACTN
MLWKATMSAFPNHADVLSISDHSGCDSADSGAWLDLNIKPEATLGGIEIALERVGWTKNVRQFMPCGPACTPEAVMRWPDMARRWEKRTIGLHLGKEETSNPSREPWTLTVQAVDHCWTDDHYTCPD